MANGKKKLGEVTVGCENDVVQLVILVAGTTDPVNSSTTIEKRAVSYPSTTPEQYWNTADSLKNYKPYYIGKPDYENVDAFYDGIKKLVAANKNAALFDAHGWSGDNREGNRNEAGAYLVDRLIGANGQVAYYGKTYQAKEIHIHLIGHSHGGNVINEMTKQMAKAGAKWPAKWKVKSFTYLSTPFFNTLHQVNVGAFVHPKAEVLNVFNKYDMTQRLLADFSLITLGDALETKLFKDLTNKHLDIFLAGWTRVPWNNLAVFNLKETEGRALYRQTLNALNITIEYLGHVQTLMSYLNKPIQYPVNKDIDLKKYEITSTYKVLSDQNLVNITAIISALISDVNTSIEAIQKGLTNNSFSKSGFFMALLAGADPLVQHIAQFIDLPGGGNNAATSGILWQTIISILSDAVEVFDDTKTEPSAQFKNARTITPLEVTSRDAYDKTGSAVNKANFAALMTRIEAIESRASAKPAPNVLLDLLLTLAVHVPIARQVAAWSTSIANGLDNAEYALTGEWDARAKRVRATLQNLSQGLVARFVGEIEDASDSRPNTETGKRGSLGYLFRESHSVSRRVLHPEVKNFLQRMMG